MLSILALFQHDEKLGINSCGDFSPLSVEFSVVVCVCVCEATIVNNFISKNGIYKFNLIVLSDFFYDSAVYSCINGLLEVLGKPCVWTSMYFCSCWGTFEIHLIALSAQSLNRMIYTFFVCIKKIRRNQSRCSWLRLRLTPSIDLEIIKTFSGMCVADGKITLLTRIVTSIHSINS